jgi:hypothetical protein
MTVVGGQEEVDAAVGALGSQSGRAAGQPLMANIGSVFLGDVQRSRLRSAGSTPGSTPPSSPPPLVHTSRLATRSPTLPTPQPEVTPAQSLELRIRWLEAILCGAKRDDELAGLRERKPELRRGETLIRAAEHVQRRMNDIANTYDVLRRFIGHCEPFSSPAAKLTTSQTNSMHNT